MKGISPLITSVMLIAITMVLAGILANWASTYTTEAVSRIQTCVGGNIKYVSAEYPKWSAGPPSELVAVVEAQGVDLGDFKFNIIFINDTVVTYPATPARSIAAGTVGDVRCGLSSVDCGICSGGKCPNIKSVSISTNCTNLKTDPISVKCL